MKFAAQLYNFRFETQKDFEGTLKRIADMGFDGVEMLHYRGPLSPAEVADLLKSLHLECAGSMYEAEFLKNPDDIAYQYAKALNSPAVTISWMGVDFTQTWQEVARMMGEIGAAAAQNGTVFSYHNHWDEEALVDGVPAIYRMLDANNPAQVFAEPDICWLNRGGVKPADFIRRYARRIRQIHFKDILVADNRDTTAPLGTGVVDLESAYQAALESDARWIIYEQDFCDDVYLCAEKSLACLKKLADA